MTTDPSDAAKPEKRAQDEQGRRLGDADDMFEAGETWGVARHRAVARARKGR